MAETAKSKTTPTGVAIKLTKGQEGMRSTSRVSTITVNGETVTGLAGHIATTDEGATSGDVLVLTIPMSKVTVDEMAE